MNIPGSSRTRLRPPSDSTEVRSIPGWFRPEPATPEAEVKAIEVMAAALRPGASELAVIGAWLAAIRDDQAQGRPLTVLGHSALTFLLREGVFKGAPEHQAELESALRASWLHLTGKDVDTEGLGGRLPRRVLSGCSRETRSFHAAIFQDNKEDGAAVNLLRGYVPEKQDAGLALLGLVCLGTEIGLDLCTGGAIGAVVASYLESFFHDHAAHAKPAVRAWANEGGIKGYLGRRFSELQYSHAQVHHGKTFKQDHVTQFTSVEEKAALDEALRAQGPKGEDIIQDRYGLSLRDESVLPFLQPYLVTATVVAFGLKLAPLAILGMVLPTVGPAFASKTLHPYLHLPKKAAMAAASAPMRLLLKTRYAELMSRLHYGHHKGRGGNFNVLPPVGDLLRGELELPNVRQMLKMKKLEMIY